MPAVVDPAKCNRNFEHCFSARVCPESAFSQLPCGDVVIDSTLCLDCSGPCVNFCDGYAIRYDPNPKTFEIMRSQLLGEITEDEAAERRLELERQPAATDTAVIELTTENFVSEVLQSELPVIVDFWAPWCGPCRKMAPVFEALASAYVGRMKFTKVDTEAQPQLAAQFGITSIPTLVVFHGGRIVDGAVGALPEPQLKALVERALQTVHQDTADQEVPSDA